MEKVSDFLANVPSVSMKVIQEQQNFRQYQDYLKKVENDIEYFREYRTFPRHSDDENDQKIKQRVLSENVKNSVQVKLERISEVPKNDSQSDAVASNIEKENLLPVKVEMPPPQMPIKKTRKTKKEPSINTRTTYTRASRQTQKESDSNIGRESDIILQKQPIETITLSDSDSDDKANTNTLEKQTKNNSEIDKNHVQKASPRRTRTKTKMKQNGNTENGKRTRSTSASTEKSSESTKQTKRKKSDEVSEEDASQYEDARGNIKLEGTKPVNGIISREESSETATDLIPEKQFPPNNLDKTIVIKKNVNNTAVVLEEKSLQLGDKTIIVDKPKIVKKDNSPTNLNDIMTDDEDDHIVVTVPKKATYHTKTGAKAIFSPFDGSPVKKRVEAFERLGVEETSNIPLRTTRTKTKAKAEVKEEASLTPKLLKSNRDLKTTPQTANRFLPTVTSSANKTMRTNAINESYLSVKSLSALKASQQEFNERESKRRDKETDAVKKRVAQLQAQTEEKRKKRLEKQVKAQQMREIQEKNKLEALKSAEKLKDERHRLLLAEKQEKAKKQQEEMDRKRVEVLKKALEEKRKEEERKRAAEEAQEKQKQEQLRKALQEERRAARALEHKKKTRGRIPIFLREKAPLLPTEDCYDSDQESGDAHKIRKPAWTSSKHTFPKLQTMKCVDKKSVSSFFLMIVTTPDLQDIFENIDPNKLKRTSSAIWKKPPRYTMMPESIEERDEEDC